MKKSLLAALALSFLASPVLTAYDASAQNRPMSARSEVRQDKREVRQDRQDLRKDRRQAARPIWLKRGGRYRNGGSNVSDYRRYGLRAPGRGQRWVRYNNDYILIGVAGGVIASIVVGR